MPTLEEIITMYDSDDDGKVPGDDGTGPGGSSNDGGQKKNEIKDNEKKIKMSKLDLSQLVELMFQVLATKLLLVLWKVLVKLVVVAMELVFPKNMLMEKISRLAPYPKKLWLQFPECLKWVCHVSVTVAFLIRMIRNGITFF